MNGNMESSDEKDLGQFFTSMLGLQKHLLATLTAQGQQQSAASANLLAEVSAKLDRDRDRVELALPSLTDEDDTVTYLSLFERAAAAARLPEQQWASALALRLTGEAEAARRAVGSGGDLDYQVLKAAVLDRGPLAEEACRARFRSPGPGGGPRPRALARELQAAASGWLKPHRRTGAEVLQRVAVEQFIARLPELTAGWVRAGRPADLEQAVKLAESHISLTGSTPEEAGGPRAGEEDEPSDRRKRHSAAPGGLGSEPGHTSRRLGRAVSNRKGVPVGSPEEATGSRSGMEREREMESPTPGFMAADSACDQEERLHIHTLKTEGAVETKEESDSYDPVTHAYSPSAARVQQEATLFTLERSYGPSPPSSSLEEEGPQGGGGEAVSDQTGLAFPWPGGEPGCNAAADHRGRQQAQDASGARRYICGECGRTFNRSTNLRRHQRIHSGEKPYVCPVCAHSFRTSTALKRHREVHTGAKLYQCPDCGKSFTYAERMLHHRTAHAALRPHRCAVCGKSFRLKKQLRKHERTHRANGAESPPDGLPFDPAAFSAYQGTVTENALFVN